MSKKNSAKVASIRLAEKINRDLSKAGMKNLEILRMAINDAKELEAAKHGRQAKGLTLKLAGEILSILNEAYEKIVQPGGEFSNQDELSREERKLLLEMLIKRFGDNLGYSVFKFRNEVFEKHLVGEGSTEFVKNFYRHIRLFRNIRFETKQLKKALQTKRAIERLGDETVIKRLLHAATLLETSSARVSGVEFKDPNGVRLYQAVNTAWNAVVITLSAIAISAGV
ncbi:MAG: hypothetical protein HY291_03555 [Planctomycetes bacterium]|nr:hypothetical protein [Planctomycetota bacterium]